MPAARALDASAMAAHWRSTRSRWPTYPSTGRQRGPFASRCCSLRHGGPRNPQSATYVQTSSTQAQQCWNTWRGTRCTRPPRQKTKRRPPISSRPGHGGARGKPRTPSAPPSQAADNVGAPEGKEEAADAAPGAGGAAHQGSIPAGLAPLWASLGAGSPRPMAPAHPGDLAGPADPTAMPVRDS